MILFSVLYPATEGASFDHEYYASSHIPVALAAWGLGPSDVEVERRVDGPFECIARFRFADMDTFGTSIGSEGSVALTEDRVNYTSIEPQYQISELRGS